MWNILNKFFLTLFPSNMNDEETIRLFEEQGKLANETIKLKYKHILENIKKMRNAFSNAVTTGRRRGSGRIITENYDKLVAIYGGAPSATRSGCCHLNFRYCTCFEQGVP